MNPNQSAVANPLASPLTGYVSISNDGPDGLAVGGYSDDPTSDHLQRGDAVVDIRRARELARDYHDWNVPSEVQLRGF